jgi:flagellar hook capping protein FlgD
VARLVSLLLAVACLLVAVPVALADPIPFNSTSGTCNPGTGTSNWSSGILEFVDNTYDLRVTTDAGPASFDLDGDGFALPGPATDWSIWDVPGGFNTSGTISCAGASSDVHWTVAWYTLPGPPATFTGTVAPGAEGSLGFQASDAGTYVVDVSVSGGSATVFQGGTSEVVSSTGQAQFDTLEGGFNEIDVDNNGATPVQYTVRVSEKPVTMTLGSTPARYATTGVSRTYQYSLSGPATVAAWVESWTGKVVRHLIDYDDQAAGNHSVVWDGRDDAGAQLPDGPYSVKLRSQNGAGSPPDLTVPAAMDTTGPTITWQKSGNVISAGDLGSGMKDLQTTVDGKAVRGTGTQFSRTIPLPPGSHTIHADALDNAGNTSQLTVQATRAVAPPPACNNALNYVAAVLNAKHFASAVGRMVETVPFQILQKFTIHKALCTDLTGDGVNDLALMLKGRGDIRFHTPIAVFKGVPSRYTYVYGDSHASYRTMSLSGRDVKLRPSHGKSRVLHWNGKHFAFRRAR